MRRASGVLQGVVGPWWWSAVILVCLRPARPSPVPPPPAACLCASDILSCTAAGLERVPGDVPASAVTLDLSHNRIERLEGGGFQGLHRLEVLRLAHNQLSAIPPGAFRNSSGPLLRHLDLSSNRLRVLEQHYFLDVPGLEELLLFNNRLVHVESAALGGLAGLRRAYLSHNRLTDFPFFSLRERSHPRLTTLDLSSNRLLRLPLDDISRLPLRLQRGLYLHNNSLQCDCSTYALFLRWERSSFSSVSDFRQEHTCLVFGMQKGTVRFFQNGHYFRKCNLTGERGPPAQEGSVSVKAGGGVLLHCATSLTGRHLSFFWVSPKRDYVAPPGNNESLRMYANGSLEIVAASAEDAGTYWCMALDPQLRRNETQEVNVTVEALQHGAHETFNTGFTTLLGCVVSLLLVLMYLYLTPCRCPPCPPPAAPPPAAAAQGQVNEAGTGSAQSSILTPTPPASTEGPGRKVSTNKHVVFLEPIREQQNGRLRAGPPHLGPGVLLGPESTAPSRPRPAETDSIMSVFSDTPIMLP